MRQIQSPTKRLTQVFGWLAALFLGGALVDFAVGAGEIALPGLLVGLVFLIILWSTYRSGKRQINEIERLLAGETLMAHWTYTPDEWARFAANERTKGRSAALRGALWTSGGTFALFLALELMEGTLDWSFLLFMLLASALFGLVRRFADRRGESWRRSEPARRERGLHRHRRRALPEQVLHLGGPQHLAGQGYI